MTPRVIRLVRRQRKRGSRSRIPPQDAIPRLRRNRQARFGHHPRGKSLPPKRRAASSRQLTARRSTTRVAPFARTASIVLKAWLIPIAFCLLGCHAGPSEIVVSGPTMGTTYTVRIVSPHRSLTSYELRRLVEDELRAVDESMSGYREDSEISRFNATASTDWFDVSRELVRVLEVALEVGAESRGAFDVTVAPLVQLWGFGPDGNKAEATPTEREIADVRHSIGIEKLRVREEPPALRKTDSSIRVDLNGIAPGYAVDRIAARLDALELRRYMVDIGGEIRVRGRNKKNESWRIAVERPELAAGEVFAVLRLEDEAVATSGEYRNFVFRDGKRYSHTVDPRTGAPIAHSLESVVVVHPQAIYADAWATAYNVLGPN